MKVQCDVCGKEEAAVFCCADEAALCTSCDRRVHRANKLAGKHRRLSLLPPSDSHSPPLCDICQEKRGFVFCQEDRVILCRDCDVPIHGANDLTKKHNRFLLTGVRLSSEAAAAPSEGAVSSMNETLSMDNTTKSIMKQEAATEATKVSVTMSTNGTSSASGTTTTNSSSSSISDYLIKMLPGWHVDDLLVDDSIAGSSFAMDGSFQNQELLPFIEADLENNGLLGVSPADEYSLWAPQVPQAAPQQSLAANITTTTAAAAVININGVNALHGYQQHGLYGGKGMNQIHVEQQQQLGLKFGRQQQQQQRWRDDAFTVPQMSPPPLPQAVISNNKRSRPASWYF